MTTRRQQIEQRLTQAFAPCSVVVTDQSAGHVGHAGARDGRGHFHVEITSPVLDGLSLLEQHRAIYAALGQLLVTDIHALSIDVQ